GQAVVGADVPIRGTSRGGVAQGRVLGPDEQPLPRGAVTVSGDGYAYDTTADPEGIFQVAAVPLGPFAVDASDPATGRAGSAARTLCSGDETVAVEVGLAGDATVAVVVTRPDGTPAAGAGVQVAGHYPF